MKRCGRCGEWKAFEAFNKRRRSAEGTQSYCRHCANAYDKRYYVNAPQQKAALRANTQEARRRNRAFVAEYLRHHACVDCGISDPLVLEFDHVRGKKTRSIAELVAFPSSLDGIRSEIQKCEVRCANCHRRKTAAERWRHYMEHRGKDFSALPSYDSPVRGTW